MRSPIIASMDGKKILILGFGKEGRSTLKFLITYVNYSKIAVADRNPKIREDQGAFIGKGVVFFLGEDYLNQIDRFDIVFKSPGIPFKEVKNWISAEKITSQTEFFLKIYRRQIIGVTGTKGKSTTSSLVHSILSKAGKDVLLVGNIGVPPLDLFDRVLPETILVYEMSSHQLEDIQISPHIAVFLNIFEEHLDHYKKMEHYRAAKYNIFRYQKQGDYLIYNKSRPEVVRDVTTICPDNQKLVFPASENDLRGTEKVDHNILRLKFEERYDIFNFSKRIGLPGEHNLKNIMAALCVSTLFNIDPSVIQNTVNTFHGLEHRLEYVGQFHGIHFYNDSIATIPEATIEAIKTLKRVNLLILGGMDRGVNFDHLIDFLSKGPVDKIVLTGQAGDRLKSLLQSRMEKNRLFSIRSFDELPFLIKKYIPKDGVCLLSPAAASYGLFQNFEERGNQFKSIVKKL